MVNPCDQVRVALRWRQRWISCNMMIQAKIRQPKLVCSFDADCSQTCMYARFAALSFRILLARLGFFSLSILAGQLCLLLFHCNKSQGGIAAESC